MSRKSHDVRDAFDLEEFRAYKGDRKPRKGSNLHYSDFDPIRRKTDVTEDDFVVPKYLSGSDYSGSLVEKSNMKTFLEEFGDEPGVFEVYGGHGTYAVAIRVGDLTEEMLEVFAGLEDYPIVDDDVHSALENEAQEEAWENWARSDFVHALKRRFPDLDDAIDEIEEGDLLQLFYKTSERIGEYWENEEGDSMYIDVEKIAKKIDETDLDDAIKGVATPNRKRRAR